MNSNEVHADPEQLRQQVRERYGAAAQQPIRSTCCGGNQEAKTTALPTASTCCGPTVASNLSAQQLAQQIGYRAEQLALLPAGANLGLSCGNPTAIAALRPGQIVLDLGCGGGFDCFIAGPQVGAAGRVIGVDMTPEMLARARGNLPAYRRSSQLDNVEFRLGEIEHLPVADASVDVVISNCVINLSIDKPQVWREIARVLRPGGSVAASDIAWLQPAPDAIRHRLDAYVGCIAGAVRVDEYRAMMEKAGLRDIILTPKPGYVEALLASHDPVYTDIAQHLPAGQSPAQFVTSLDIKARR